ncbi:hypothetical protein BaRGS_00015586 [Batillaria attramentaria]|uniref:Secreted protein n=1 Tax=Batillaria attramentaria TaxID=370345 RepID=A0ABD0L1G5_9CAEN
MRVFVLLAFHDCRDKHAHAQTRRHRQHQPKPWLDFCISEKVVDQCMRDGKASNNAPCQVTRNLKIHFGLLSCFPACSAWQKRRLKSVQPFVTVLMGSSRSGLFTADMQQTLWTFICI